MLRLYDTRRRAVIPFRPRGDAVTIYVCGVTPYDTTHLGHARTFVVFDVLVRLLELRGRTVRYAQNVTDIDESILQRARRDGVDWRALAKREERAFLADMRRLGWRKPDVLPHATREIPGMRRLVEALDRKGAAYRLPAGVYFPIAAAPRYGELSRYSRARMARICAAQDDAFMEDSGRRDTLDFALWRLVEDGPTWPSPWGRGRPGWHLECSAMALRHLGERIDIHGGGSDLVYPHHENEIAQSETATGVRPVVGIWMHVAVVRLDQAKMSKSDGNMVFVRDALRRAPPQALRLYLLDVQYRRPFDHDERRLARAGERAVALAAALGRGPRGPLGRDAGTRE
ncbi:MAG: cysteine--tRNA ligase, partial [Candidatus Limnocylindria bacterium]